MPRDVVGGPIQPELLAAVAAAATRSGAVVLTARRWT